MANSTQTIYTDATIITLNSSRDIILNGFIIVTDSRITAIGSISSLPDALRTNIQTTSLQGRIVIPGLINTHAHLAQSILRGLAEDLPLHNWLCDSIWPLESCYEGDDGYVAARLTCAEMLKSGTTCFLEAMCTHRAGFEGVVKAVGESGIRGCIGKLVKFEETNKDLNITDPRDRDLSSMSIPSMLSAHEEFDGSYDDRIHVWAAAGTPRGSPLSSHHEIGKTCKKHDIGLTMHCAEAPKDLEIYRSQYDMTPMEFCQQAELTGAKTVLAHMVHLDLATDLPILKETGTTVAHNPNSNLKLASGIAKIPEMLEADINVSLGTDGAPCGNTYDMFREMHLASILHKGANLNASLTTAEQVLEMATRNGARALGLEKEIGSLEVGKKADFVVINPNGVGCAPWDVEQVSEGGISPVTVVVHSCTGRDVEMVVVDGKVLVKAGNLVSGDEDKILNAAKMSVKGIRQRSGIKVGKRAGWKYV
ncbi:5-methylthioadenosine/S-adenosylhomocysteine deaminase n1 [Leptodontidium sp. MPI-SDFR-AT-0119]|nr:5-methylthioadenosine/S-adenosylhomocysteine deaminase n1 [Leptodontidium sp. MPI-SDFR-AT-0119]